MISNLQKIEVFQERILDWYKVFGRKFPWRARKLPKYRLVLTEILLQRTKAETVNNFYKTFFTKYPNWKALSMAPKEELSMTLKPLGLSNQRGERLFRLTQEMKKLNWKLPTDYRVLESLPMMGQYISNSIKLLVHNESAPLLDVNMARVLERYFGSRKLADIRYDPYLQTLANSVAQHEKIREINWAILDFAALVCKARNPLCIACPLNESCIYFNIQK